MRASRTRSQGLQLNEDCYLYCYLYGHLCSSWLTNKQYTTPFPLQVLVALLFQGFGKRMLIHCHHFPPFKTLVIIAQVVYNETTVGKSGRKWGEVVQN
jgi:hypothetical protein